MNEKFYILIKILLNFVHKGPIGNNPALVETMAWRWIGDNLLYEPMRTRLIDGYCGPRGWWVTVMEAEKIHVVCTANPRQVLSLVLRTLRNYTAMHAYRAMTHIVVWLHQMWTHDYILYNVQRDTKWTSLQIWCKRTCFNVTVSALWYPTHSMSYPIL